MKNLRVPLVVGYGNNLVMAEVRRKEGRRKKEEGRGKKEKSCLV
ncbi:hypothetical protein [Okeania sp. SIO2C2]|nr:hypothetical protein [Okeania sp. SIO2C2]